MRGPGSQPTRIAALLAASGPGLADLLPTLYWDSLCSSWRGEASQPLAAGTGLFGPRLGGSSGLLAVLATSASGPASERRQFVSLFSSRRYLHSSAAVHEISHVPSAARSPLQRRLADAGVQDWAAYDKPHHSELSSEAEIGEFVSKVVELVKEGLVAEDVDRLFQQSNNPWACSLECVFLPNLQYLRSLLAGATIVRAPYEPAGLTPLGRLLRGQAHAMAIVLSRNPALLSEPEQWVCGELGVPWEQFAGVVPKCPYILQLRVGTARAAAVCLGKELGMWREQVISVLLRRPEMFLSSPDSLSGKIAQLQHLLGISDYRVVAGLVRKLTNLLMYSLQQLPGVLGELDGLFGREGAGVEVVKRAPSVAIITVAALRRAVQALRGMGLDENAVQEAVESYPTLLGLDLEGPGQQQKLEWGRAELGWPLPKLMAGRIFGASLRMMASRLAFMRHLGLPDPGSLSFLSTARQAKFLKRVCLLAGREVGAAEFEAWVAAWLQTPQGRKYGFKPEGQRGL